MAKPKVYVTREIPKPGMDVVKPYCEVEVNQSEQPPTKAELVLRVSDKDGLICLVTDQIDNDVLASAPQLKAVSSISVGFNHIDVSEATKRGIYVTYTPGVLTDATADFTWALIMATARRVAEADRYVRDLKWKIAWAPMMFLGSEVYGRTLGIIGLGRIGSAVAERAKGFRMKLMYYDPVRAPTQKEKELGIEYTSLEKVLKQADFVTVHVPYLPETHHMIGRDQLRMMKPTAHLVNTARGPIVDEAALATALKEKWIAGAALDVFAKEPIESQNPLLHLENATVTPHIASATVESRFSMARIAAENLIAVLKGEKPTFLVNAEVMTVRPLSRARML